MLVSLAEYTERGYATCPPSEFTRYELMAEQRVMRYTQGRAAANITDENIYGVCELIELLYADTNGSLQTGAVTSFSNSRYSESYATPTAKSVDERAADIIANYFTAEQRWRGFECVE